MRALLLLLLPGSAFAQSSFYEDDFSCSSDSSFALPSGDAGWVSTYAADSWTSAGMGGVGPNTDDSTGGFGAPLDGYENALLTGHLSWTDVAIRAEITDDDDDAHGLVARVSGPRSYYSCYYTLDNRPDCNGGGQGGAPGAALLRVDANAACVNDYVVAEQPNFAFNPGATYLMELSVIADEVTCTVDVDLDGVLGSAGDLVLAYTDPSPLVAGQAGLWAFNDGNSAGDLEFDNVLVTGFDPDADADGLSDAAEVTAGTDPNNPDTDGDTLSDREEALYQQAPPDTDGDGDFDAVDEDSDDDGLRDVAEAGDGDLATAAVDTDCDGTPDYREDDSDGDGDLDGNDNCPTLFNPVQLDGDNDGLGDLCDPGLGDDDADDDGILDGNEVLWGTDPDNADTDGDGLTDGAEIGLTAGEGNDTDPAAFVADGDAGATTTNPASADTDGDGLSDGLEDADQNGELNAGETDPNDADTDVDGLVDGAEDADADGIVDATETDPLDPDSDGDGTLDGADCAPLDPLLPAVEVAADGVDQDCDGGDLCYVDDDGDGFGTASTVAGDDLDCTNGAGESDNPGDCDDSAPAISPGGAELPANGGDEDCDGVDDCFVDGDTDGVGSADVAAGDDLDCTNTAGESERPGDCDDTNGNLFPGNPEVAGDGLDQDCDGVDDCYADLDGDGYGETAYVGNDLDCTDPNETSASGDCNESNPAINPGADDVIGDGIDQDCDGGDDCYRDGDGDGFGDDVTASTDLSCDHPGLTLTPGDCDDDNADAFPGGTEAPADGADGDCDGEELCFVDGDGDGFGATSTEAAANFACLSEGVAPTDDDCDDATAEIFPGADEIGGDEIDQDCDGEDAEAGPVPVVSAGGCGCDAGANPGSGLALAVGLLALAGRRRSPVRG